MKFSGRFIIQILLIATLFLSACTVQKPVSKSEVKKPASTQSPPLSEMDTQFLYLAAQKAMKDGNVPLAIELLEALSTKDPEAAMPRMQLVELLLHQRMFDRAEIHIKHLIANKTLSAKQLERVSMLLARAQTGQGHTDDALATLAVFLKQQPANIAARDLQAQILSSQKRIDEALLAIAEAIQARDIAEFRLLQAQLLIRKGDSKQAISSLRRLQKLAPDNETAALMLSSIAIKENKQKQAEKELRGFLGNHPDSLTVGNALGQLLAQQDRLDEAIIIYQDIAKQSGNAPAVLQTLGLLYLQVKKFKQAEETFRELLENQSIDSHRFYLAASLEALERDDEAQKIYAQINKKSILYIDVQMRLASIAFRHDKMDEAEKWVNNILQKKPAYLDAHLLRSAIRINQKKYQLLLDESESILAGKKLPAQLLLNRAVAFDHLKHFRQAEAMLKRILKNKPEHAEALNFLGYIYAVEGVELEQAKELINRALKLKPDDGYYLDSLAWVHYKSGNFGKALNMQKKALKVVSDDAVMFEHLGDILWRTDDKKGARKAWQKSIGMKAENPALLKRKITEGLNNSE